jgi:hypothetical protein
VNIYLLKKFPSPKNRIMQGHECGYFKITGIAGINAIPMMHVTGNTLRFLWGKHLQCKV